MSNKEHKALQLEFLKILKEKSDEENPISAKELEEELERLCLPCNRKTIYRTIEELSDTGYDISTYKENKVGYYLRYRDFDDDEIRILMDVVVASKSITHKKTDELLKKILTLTSIHKAKKFRKQVYVYDRVKCYNEEIKYNIDKITTAIENQKKITFQYFDFDINKNLVPRKKGEAYKGNPISLVYYQDFYYLIVYNESYGDFNHYRVDRMKNIKVLQDDVCKDYLKIEEYKSGFNPAIYLRKTFNMFSGDEKSRVDIKFKKNLVNMVIDKFGKDIIIEELDANSFKISVEVSLGKGFIMWILQYGSDAEVISPESVREGIKKEIEKIYKIYE